MQTIIEMFTRSRSVIIRVLWLRAAELAGSGVLQGPGHGMWGNIRSFLGAPYAALNGNNADSAAHAFCIPRNDEGELTAHRGFHVDVPPSLIQSVRLVQCPDGNRLSRARPSRTPDRFSRLEEVFGITYVVGVEGAPRLPAVHVDHSAPRTSVGRIQRPLILPTRLCNAAARCGLPIGRCDSRSPGC